MRRCTPKSVRSFDHYILMVASPGARNTLLARVLPGILAEMITLGLDLSPLLACKRDLLAARLVEERRGLGRQGGSGGLMPIFLTG